MLWPAAIYHQKIKREYLEWHERIWEWQKGQKSRTRKIKKTSCPFAPHHCTWHEQHQILPCVAPHMPMPHRQAFLPASQPNPFFTHHHPSYCNSIKFRNSLVLVSIWTFEAAVHGKKSGRNPPFILSAKATLNFAEFQQNPTNPPLTLAYKKSRRSDQTVAVYEKKILNKLPLHECRSYLEFSRIQQNPTNPLLTLAYQKLREKNNKFWSNSGRPWKNPEEPIPSWVPKLPWILQNSTKFKQSAPNPNIPKIEEREQQILIKIVELKEAAASYEHYKGTSYQYILGNKIQISSTSSEFLILQTCDTKP